MKVAALVLVVLLGGSAYARPGRAKGPRPQSLRVLVMQHFDRNHDGRLEPRERKQAKRALRRLAQRMTAKRIDRPRARGREPGDARRNKLIKRYDLDRDGDIGPGEMPPVLADELRPLDVDGDGWLQGNELP
jgi:hypothetical protein